MCIMINNVIGEKRINLSYPIQNSDSSKEVAVVSMFSDNIQYEITKTLEFKLIDGSEKNIKWNLYKKRNRCDCRKKTHTCRFER